MSSNTLSPSEIRDRIAAVIDTERANLIADTQKLMSFRTVSGGNEQEEALYLAEIPKCLDFLKSVSDRMGFTFRNWDNRFAEIAWESGSGGRPVIGIAAHIDVVPPAGNWTHGPFDADIVDGVMISRGTQDDKGPLMQSLYGMYAVKQAGIELPVDVRVIIGTCEETGDWDDIKDYLLTRGAPDFAYTPDAAFPITTGEKGMSTLEFSAQWDAVQPDLETALEFVSLKAGSRANIVPDLCEITLRAPLAQRAEVMKELMRSTTDLTVQHHNINLTLLPEKVVGDKLEIVVSFLGKPAHGSTPEKGHNAALDALLFLSDVTTIPAPVRAFIQFLYFVGRELDGSNLMINAEHPFIGKTTVNLGVVEIGATGGSGLLNVRPTMGVSVQTVQENARNAAASFSASTGLTIVSEAYGKMMDAIYMDPEDPKVGPYLQALQHGFTQVTGQPATLEAIGGSTYSKAFPVCCAFGPILHGEDEELAHQADERFAVSSIVRNANIYGVSLALMR